MALVRTMALVRNISSRALTGNVTHAPNGVRAFRAYGTPNLMAASLATLGSAPKKTFTKHTAEISTLKNDFKDDTVAAEHGLSNEVVHEGGHGTYNAVSTAAKASLSLPVTTLANKHRVAEHGTPKIAALTKSAIDLFDLTGTVHLVTGGSQGLGLSMAIGLAEAGATVYCVDRAATPSEDFREAQKMFFVNNKPGSLEFYRVDVTDRAALNALVQEIANGHGRLDGVVAAAGIQQKCASIDYPLADAQRMMDINFHGVFTTATAGARQMMRLNHPGSIVLIASMSGLIANRGLICPVYNASKAAVIQLARNLAMEWSAGRPCIRVNALSPGHIVTPMVEKDFRDHGPGLRAEWEANNMLHRLAVPEEFKGAGLFLLSPASSFMTGGNLVIDGGHTAW